MHGLNIINCRSIIIVISNITIIITIIIVVITTVDGEWLYPWSKKLYLL